jgi:aminoglycoside phosphotransferase (APT) family kinase protein
MAAGDIVHADFAPENILAEDGRLVAVVDWERSRVGDAGLDLVGAIVDTESRERVSAAARRRLWSAARARMPADVLACYVGLYAARYASWAIGTTVEADVLTLAARLLAETGDDAA